MVTKTLSTATVVQDFPGGTVDPGYTFTIVGTLADGTPFAVTVNGADPSIELDLEAGTYVGTVSKLGVNSLPSEPLTIEAPVTVSITVPDAAQAAVFA